MQNSDYMITKKEHLKFFSGSTNHQLAEEIATFIDIPLGKIFTGRYPDGEIKIQLKESVREKDVYLLQSTCPPSINDNLMEIILLISTMRRASARRVTAIIPYFGYSRQDRKFSGRVPISAADVSNLLESVGVDRVVVLDLHCQQMQGFFAPRTPCDNLDTSIIATAHFIDNKRILSGKTVIVSPDAGGVQRAKKFREILTNKGYATDFAIIIKQRGSEDQINSCDLIGDVNGKHAVIVDDIIGTGGTVVKAAEKLKECGAKDIAIFATHGLFGLNAVPKIESSCIKKVVVTNTVPLSSEAAHCPKIEQISIAPLIGKVILRMHERGSLSDLF